MVFFYLSCIEVILVFKFVGVFDILKLFVYFYKLLINEGYYENYVVNCVILNLKSN